MSVNPDSILDSVKKVLGFESEYTAFDLDVTMFINAAFGSLQQLGIGSSTGFYISDNTTLWPQYISQLSYLGMVQTYIFMSAKLAFDPPGNSFGIDAIKYQLEQLAWRINVAVEALNPPTDPFLSTDTESEIVEGGILKNWFAPKLKVLDSAATVVMDATDGNLFYLTLLEDATVNAPVNGAEGEHITLEITSNGFAVVWGSGWNFGAPGTPDLTSDKTDIISSVYRGSATGWFSGFSPGF
jgi:hypothetical protein